jgi:hypothetical protein
MVLYRCCSLSQLSQLSIASYSSETEPYEWYQSYAGMSHLLTPAAFSGLQGMDPAQPRRILEPFMVNHSQHHHHHHRDAAAAAASLQQQVAHQQQRAQARVLVLGCGNSRLSEDMLRDGWTGGIVNVDFSEVVIDQLKAKVGCFSRWLGLLFVLLAHTVCVRVFSTLMRTTIAPTLTFHTRN